MAPTDGPADRIHDGIGILTMSCTPPGVARVAAVGRAR
jgi:hypothetical protein